MNKEELVARVSDAAGLSPSRCREATEIIFEVIGRKLLGGEHIWIEDFGVFNPVSSNGMHRFKAAKPLQDYLDNYQPLGPEPERFYHVTPDEPMPQGNPANLLPVHPIAQEDLDIIERWLKWKQGQVTAAIPEILYLDSPETGMRVPSVFGSEVSVNGARQTLRTFVRRLPTTLRTTGLTGDPGEFINYETGALRRDIMLYARDYEQRMIKRLGDEGMRKLTERSRRRARVLVPIFFRTVGWRKFSTYARELFDWMEIEGLRPKGSNPMAGMRRFYEVPRNGGELMINRNWYGTVLAYPRMLPKERAVIYLLQNGLRRTEVANLKLEHLNLKNRRAYVIGKGNKARHVYLYPWTVAAINEWLEERRNSMSPWVFPNNLNQSLPIALSGIAFIVKDVCHRVFPNKEQEHIIKHIHPHGFRHYFASTATLRQVDPKTVMDAMGISSYKIFMQYIQVDDTRRNKEFAKVAKRRPF